MVLLLLFFLQLLFGCSTPDNQRIGDTGERVDTGVIAQETGFIDTGAMNDTGLNLDSGTSVDTGKEEPIPDDQTYNTDYICYSKMWTTFVNVYVSGKPSYDVCLVDIDYSDPRYAYNMDTYYNEELAEIYKFWAQPTTIIDLRFLPRDAQLTPYHKASDFIDYNQNDFAILDPFVVEQIADIAVALDGDLQVVKMYQNFVEDGAYVEQENDSGDVELLFDSSREYYHPQNAGVFRSESIDPEELVQLCLRERASEAYALSVDTAFCSWKYYSTLF